MRVQVDFNPEVGSNLFRVRGGLTLAGSSPLPYLMLNATLSRRGQVAQSTRYMLLTVEPGTDHSFEISKSMRIEPGSYNCTLEVAGPSGIMWGETRRCQADMAWAGPAFGTGSVAVVEGMAQSAWEKAMEERIRMEEIQAEGVQPASEGVLMAGSSEQSRNLSADPFPSRPTEPETRFVGSATSNKYHRPDCRSAQKIKPENRIYFASEEDAHGQGYLPCKTCTP